MDEINCTPPELREVAEHTISELLPEKSKAAYDKEYQKFKCWCIENKASKISENVLLAYFQQESQSKKSSTLWVKYSMLRACLNIYEDLDISKFLKLQVYLKKQSSGYEPKKSKILEEDEVNRFIELADNNHYLAIKVSFNTSLF